jgi:hypothetical protein
MRKREVEGVKPVRMAIESGWLSMRSPSSVSNASMRIKDLVHVDAGVGNELLELGHLADLLEGEDFILLVSIDSQTSRVVASVL